MNEEVTTPPAPGGEADTPVALVKSGASIAQILGKIYSEEIDPLGSPAANNTRWVFDVTTQDGKQISVKLLDFRSGRGLAPDVMSFSFAPSNRVAYQAQPVLKEEEGKLLIDTLRTEKSASFRVFVDIMHSATR